MKIQSISNVMTTSCVFLKHDSLHYILQALEQIVETKEDLKRVQKCVASIEKKVGDNVERNEFWRRVTSTIKEVDLRDYSVQFSMVKAPLIKAYNQGYIALNYENKIVWNGRGKNTHLAILTAIALGYMDADTGECNDNLKDGFCECLYAKGKSVRSAYSRIKSFGTIDEKNMYYEIFQKIKHIIYY